MISLQSHNQVLYHLSQLTSAFIPRQSSFTDRVKKCNESNTGKTDILCQSSLIEAAKNCTELCAEMINVPNLKIALQEKQNYGQEILDQIFVARNSKWKVSYVSGMTFAENKRGFPCSQLSEPIILPAIYLSGKHYRLFHNLCTATSFGYNIQVRSFKTERYIKTEMERNPTLSTRLQKWIDLSTPVNQFDKMSLHGAPGRNLESEGLRNLLNDVDVPANEQQRVKLAFAEGYIAGRKQKPQNFFFKFLKTLQTLTIIFLFLLCGFGLLGMYKSLSTGKFFKFHLNSPIEVNPEEINVTFNDVKGAQEAKQELMEIVEFLKNPNKFSALGGKLPKGVLLIGPPGTGKTLLARAVAGEANVPFFHVAGPEFDEVLVGQGARRIRDLFKAAKRRAPCVIFIDEIDSVGAKRTNSALHPYANQTINQLLTEMDGFRQNEGVIVLGATNRRNDLDKALLRPGRFDVEVQLTNPDLISRKEILTLYLGKILTRDIDVDSLAKGTTGFTGADIENLINQAALRAAIDGADYVTMQHMEYAKDKMLLGPERKLRMPDQEATLMTAYHEGGHALVGCLTKGGDPLHKVTIISRGPSLGQTMYRPEKDRYHITKSYLLAKMDTMMGGRAAEELIFGPDRITAGAASDFQSATGIAEAMIKQYGMSEKIGFRTYPDSESESNSAHTNELIDSEMKRLLQESYDRAKAILKAHPKELKEIAEALIKYETLELEDVKAILNGQKIRVETDGNKTPIIDVPKNVM